MPDGKANYVFFGVDWGATENTSSPPGTMKRHMAFPFSGLALSVLRHSHVQWDHLLWKKTPMSQYS